MVPRVVSMRGLSGVALAAAAAGCAFWTGQLSGRVQQRSLSWKRAVSVDRWTPQHYAAVRLMEIAEWGVRETQPGNAAPLFWPDGVKAGMSVCGHTLLGSSFQDAGRADPARVQAAASCARVEDIVRAARLQVMDMGDWLRSGAAWKLPDAEPWMHVYRAPIHDIGAVIARAHLRIEQGDLDGGEADARAAVSAGLHLMNSAVDMDGLIWTTMTLTSALDHQREIQQRRGDAQNVLALARAKDRVQLARNWLNQFRVDARKAAARPETIHRLRQVAEDPAVQLGLRAHVVLLLGSAYLANPVEAAFGPADERLAMLAALEQQPELAPAVQSARTGFDVPVRQRFERLQQLWAIMD